MNLTYTRETLSRDMESGRTWGPLNKNTNISNNYKIKNKMFMRLREKKKKT